jgi:hypothetical protein
MATCQWIESYRWIERGVFDRLLEALRSILISNVAGHRGNRHPSPGARCKRRDPSPGSRPCALAPSC